MSRHRYVRNLDIDSELADDAGGEYDDEYYDGGGFSGEADSGDEPDDGMTPEERAQMASALPVVRENLKDIKPPIADKAIQDALWHYWFDVDKASSWLRKEREKKGDPSIALPAELFPTPDQQPRPRPSLRQRRPAPLRLRTQVDGTKEDMASPPDAPSPPLSALQRLSLARKQQQAVGSSPTTQTHQRSLSGMSHTRSLSGMSHTRSPSLQTEMPTATTPQEGGKPMSKLALLAQKRREGMAQPPTGTSPVTPTPPSPMLASASPTDTTKPMSKLAQKMAAARAARAEGSLPSPSAPDTTGSGSTPGASPVDEPIAEETWDLFPSPPETSAPPSTFFNLLTTHTAGSSPPNPPSLANMHIAVRGDLAAAEQRVRDAFGPGVESPDDIVLRMRDGRAGTGLTAPATEARPIKAAVRAERPQAPPAEVRSEVEAAAAASTTQRQPSRRDSATSTKSSSTTATASTTTTNNSSSLTSGKPGGSKKSGGGYAGQAPRVGKAPGGKNIPKPNPKSNNKGLSATSHSKTSGVTPQFNKPPPSSSSSTSTAPPKAEASQSGARGNSSGQQGKPNRPQPKVATPSDGSTQPKAKAKPKPKPQPKAEGGQPQVAKAAATPPPSARSKSLPAKQRVASSKPGTPKPPSSKATSASSTPRKGTATPLSATDMAGLHIGDEVDEEALRREAEKFRERPVLSMKQEELVAKVKEQEEQSGKKNLSLVVVGHVDAGKSTLMGRLLYELGELSEKEKQANDRGSQRAGKSSFAFAWGLDALGDERDRGVTIDIATTHFETPHRNITLLDAPGHRDFIPAMISGAAQADVALLVVDGSPGEFESGFERGGQTREHAFLVRALGVKEVIVAVNKMDVVGWSQDRYDEIVNALRPFLASAGFSSAKTVFLPLAAMRGTNMVERDMPPEGEWYHGQTLVSALDNVSVPERPYSAPLRIPLSNVFKGQTAVASGVAVQGRLTSGVLQTGDQLRAVPGDVVASVRTIEVDDDIAPYAVAGQNATLYLAGVDANQLAIGTVLCPVSYPCRLVSKFVAQILVFDIAMPIIIGTPVELFHHSVNVPAHITRLLSISEKGKVVKTNPRVVAKGTTASVEITLRPPTGSTRPAALPLETAAENKEMGRVLLRRGGETIAAGIITELL